MTGAAPIFLEGADATEALGARFASQLRIGDTVALFGDLGTGKTVFARGLLRGLGFEGEVASPTFPIVIPYDELSVPVRHVDLYRIEHESELVELALEEARGEAALVIEWPERLGSGLWPDSLLLSLVRAGEGRRALTVGVPAAWARRWPPR